MQAYVHEMTLHEEDDFSKKFNYVSWLWAQACNPLNSLEKQDFYHEEYCTQKFNLERGLPVSFLSEYMKDNQQ